MKELEKEVKEYLIERGWDTLRPSDIAKSISIEAAELLEIFQWGSSTIEDVKKSQEKLEAIHDELPDVLIYCLEMAVLLDLDTEEIIRAKLNKVKEKYPADRMKNRDKTQGAEDVYLKLKKEHRAKKFQE